MNAEYSPRLAVVTGASSGIGEHYARYLAGRGYDLVLAARRTEPLSNLAAELSRRHGAEISTVAGDLSTPSGVDDVIAAVATEEDGNRPSLVAGHRPGRHR